MNRILLSILLLASATGGAGQYASINVSQSGAGKPVIYLPGFTTPGSIWDETIAHLRSPRKNYVVTYAGFGDTKAIDTPWYPALKRDLIRFIESENLKDLTLIGHSMGGNLATEITAALPGRISKLILVDAIPCMRELMMPGVSASQIQYKSPYNEQVLAMSDEAFMQVAHMIASNMVTSDAHIDTLKKWMKSADRKTYAYGYTDLLRLDLRDQLPLIRIPTLILGATFPDAATVKTTYEKQYALLADKDLRLANNSKHFIMLDQPVWFYEQVNEFLNR